jgi:hypothetical protein
LTHKSPTSTYAILFKATKTTDSPTTTKMHLQIPITLLLTILTPFILAQDSDSNSNSDSDSDSDNNAAISAVVSDYAAATSAIASIFASATGPIDSVYDQATSAVGSVFSDATSVAGSLYSDASAAASSFGGDFSGAGAAATATEAVTSVQGEPGMVTPTTVAVSKVSETGVGSAASTSESEGKLRRNKQRADGVLFAAIFAAVAYL